MTCYAFSAEAVTPLVIAGASGGGSGPREEGLRPPSLRGGMRFWFRAMMGGIVDTREGHTALHELEARVFGATDGASAVRVRTSPKKLEGPEDAFLRMNDARPIRQGVRAARRAALSPGSTFEIKLEAPSFRTLQVAAQALWMTSALGGVGNRSRRGFGSLFLQWEGAEVGSRGQAALPELACKDADLTSAANWLQGGLGLVRRTYGEFAGDRRRGMENARPSFSVLAPGRARLWVVGPGNGLWREWTQAIDDLRERFYRPFKGHLGADSIGRRYGAGPDGTGLLSPLAIQIKKTAAGGYFGVLLAFENSRYFDRDGEKWAKLEELLGQVAREGNLATRGVELTWRTGD